MIGLDSHPDTFTAALLRGQTPAAAVTEKIFNKVPMAQLTSWAKKHTTAEDLFVLEASGNSFQVVRTLAAVERRALVLESCQMGKLKEAHANNDKISAVRIGKAYLAGTAKDVWVPDPKTQERRDWFHAHRKAVKRTTQMRNRLQSYLSDNGVRFSKGTPSGQRQGRDRTVAQSSNNWSARQWQVIEGLLMELRHADEQRQHWRSLIAQEVLAGSATLVHRPAVRRARNGGLCPGRAHRRHPPLRRTPKLVKYIGLNPAFDDSGEGSWQWRHRRSRPQGPALPADRGGPGHPAHSKNPLARWGKKLLARKGSINLAVGSHGPQTGRGRLVSDDGPLDPVGRNRRATGQGRQDHQLGRPTGT